MKRAAIAIVLLCLFGLPTLGICADEQLPPEWTFDDEDEIKNWTGLHHLVPLEIDEVRDKAGDKRSILRTLSIDADPYVYLDGNANGFFDIEPFDGATYDIVYIGLRVNKASSWQIFYITPDDRTYTGDKRQNFPVSASDDFQNLEFKMAGSGWTKNSIAGFRLDPGGAIGIEGEIDYISLRGIPRESAPKAVRHRGKLAVTWGAMKN